MNRSVTSHQAEEKRKTIRLTSVERIAKPGLFWIVMGGLKGYIKHPVIFMLGVIVRLPITMHEVSLELPKDFVKSNTLIVLIYRRLARKMEKQEAFEIMRSVILCSALSVMQANFRNVEAKRSFDNLVCYQQRAKEEGATRLNKVEIVEMTDTYYEYRVTKCTFYEFFKHMGTPELTEIMCAVDNAVFNTYLPNEVRFYRSSGCTIAEGNCYCEFILKKEVKSD